jgi:hypothetical protein
MSYGDEYDIEFSTLLGKTLTSVTGSKGDDEMIFTTSDGERYKLYHDQDCCENVQIEDVTGYLQDLIGEPILVAEEVVNPDYIVPHEDIDCESFTWTFYKLATRKGYVDIRWFGESNGYYSESVDFCKLNPTK